MRCIRFRFDTESTVLVKYVQRHNYFVWLSSSPHAGWGYHGYPQLVQLRASVSASQPRLCVDLLPNARQYVLEDSIPSTVRNALKL